jgi:carbon-monoxide dehydrogenase catalytic subunit
MSDPQTKSICPATVQLLEKAYVEKIPTVFDRSEAIKPCPIGAGGSCCKHCAMGPCRLTQAGIEAGERQGVCGATGSTVAARNFVRMVAAGTAAHADHGRSVAESFRAVVNGEASGYGIKDEQKLLQLALDFGVEVGERSLVDLARDVAEKVLAEFGRQQGELHFCKRAPLKRQELWRELGVIPRGIDREVVETLHRTHVGVDQDYRHLVSQGARTALADGWGGSMIATELQDVIFGTPAPVPGKVNLGVLQSHRVNIIIHGHEPLLSEMIVAAARDPELVSRARALGAEGINVAGICCTANEILMRHGIPLAGNFLQQELAIITGAVEAMVVDVQCVMQSLPQVAQCYHTHIITTSPKAKIPGATHLEINEYNALETAKKIVRMAVENFPRRGDHVHIPNETMDLVAGFSHETINYLQGGLFRASYRPLNDNIINGRIRGVAGVVGCNNPRVKHEDLHVKLVKELIKNDVLVLQTGCAAMSCAKAGLMVPEAAARYAGVGLAEVCEVLGIPPVLHLGSCVDNSRILMAATAMVKEGGLGDDLSDLPVAGAALEWMSEKALAIGQYFVASGIMTVFGVTWPTAGSQELTDYLMSGLEETFKGTWAFEPDPLRAARLIINHIDQKRQALGIDQARERILYDMAMRRQLDAL